MLPRFVNSAMHENANLIIVRNAVHASVLRIFSGWLEQFRELLHPDLQFAWYGPREGHSILLADQWVENEFMARLVHTLQLDVVPAMGATPSADGYLTIIDPVFFPPERLGSRIHLFLPPDKMDFNGVYWITRDQEVYSTSFDHRTMHVRFPAVYKEPVIDLHGLPDPVLFTT